MEAPIHAANQVDKGETMPKIIAGIGGLVVIVLAVLAVAYFSGFWSPPATSIASSQTHTTQSQSQ